MSTEQSLNLDPAERAKFDEVAAGWWDPEGESKPLHELNPARLRFIRERVELDGARIIDVGCGGGILSESLATEGADVVGIDIASRALDVARLHGLESGVTVDYQLTTVEELALSEPGSADVVTCMELLEHVPDPSSVIRACTELLKPGGKAFFSTLNRTPAAFAIAIVGAEHIARLLPRGTHRYDRFIRPSEMSASMRAAGLKPEEMCGLHYNPVTGVTRLGGSLAINYLAYATRVTPDD